MAYMAGELWAWTQYLDRRREGRRLQKAYRDLAWFVARRVSSGRRVDGELEYYEAMTQYQASGAFESSPGTRESNQKTTPRPSMDRSGLLAREIYSLDDPDIPEGGIGSVRQGASVLPGKGHTPVLRLELEQQYPPTGGIRRPDPGVTRISRGTTMVGVILANHLLSAVDALVSGRLGIAGETEPPSPVPSGPGPYNTRGLASGKLRLPPHETMSPDHYGKPESSAPRRSPRKGPLKAKELGEGPWDPD